MNGGQYKRLIYTKLGTILIDRATMTIRLPSCRSTKGGTFKLIKTHTDSGTVIIVPNGTDKINGMLSDAEIYAKFDYLTLFSDGSQWIILDGRVTEH